MFNTLPFILDSVLFAIGLGALLVLFLPFSPMTIDLVNLRRETQIAIYRRRGMFWLLATLCLGLLSLRGAYALITADPGTAATGSALAASTPAWFWAAVITSAIMAVMFWSGYVPFVMTPPRNPKVLSVAEGDRFIKPDEVVLGFEYGDETRAYPRDTIARPHYFNDQVDTQRFTISYCILCNSGVAFKSEIAGRPVQLRCVTAYNNNIIYYDPGTDNFIQQLDGRIIDGPDYGKALEAYPVTMATWAEWKTLHPDTKLYYAPPNTLRDKMVGQMLKMMIPIQKLAKRDGPWHRIRGTLDTRLPAMSFVFGVELDGDVCAYPVDALSRDPVRNDTVGDQKIAVFYDVRHNIGQLFKREVRGQTLTFQATDTSNEAIIARDAETGSGWNAAGAALDGPLKGEKLKSVPHFNKLFWFSWALFRPSTRISQ